MGNSLSAEYITYAVPTDPPPYPDSTPVFRSAVFPSGLVYTLPGVKWDSPWDIFQYRLAQPGARDATFLGSRLWNPEKQETELGPPGECRWATYGEIEELAVALARGIRHRGILQTTEYPEEAYVPGRRMRFLGVISKNRHEWFITEQATCADAVTLVPMYDSLGDEAMLSILEQTQMSAIAASFESGVLICKLLIRLKQGHFDKDYRPALTHLILFDRPTDDIKIELAEPAGIQLIHWKELVKEGRQNTDIVLTPQTAEDVGTLCYTSGTTGSPKGVITTARNFAAIVAAHQRCIMNHPGFRAGENDLHISYLPLAHVFERLICSNCIALGVKIACYSGDTQKLLDDMKVIRPTVFLSVPRLYSRINDKVMAGIQDKAPVAQFLFNSAMNAKLKNLREKGIYTHPIWDPLVFSKTRKLMGGNVKFMLVGGAPLEPIVQERMSVLFCCPLMHGFGMTEMGASFICNPGERVAGHIGGVQPCLEFILRSIPEMNYTVDGEEVCGELCVRGYSVTPGYLMNPEATKEAIDPNGWLNSGDVAVLLPGNCIKIIDRRKNIFKLSQGEYVAPERVEAVYTRTPLVGQIFVHGESTKPYLVGIVVPDEEMAARWANSADRPFSSLAELCQDSEFYEAVRVAMEDAAREVGLKGFEKVKKFVMISDPFSVENELLTPTLKLRRHVAKQRFARELAEMYA